MSDPTKNLPAACPACDTPKLAPVCSESGPKLAPPCEGAPKKRRMLIIDVENV